MMKQLILFLFLYTFISPVIADAVKEDPLEREMLAIAMKLRCAVCQNQPVAESNSGLAQDMRASIREQLQQGKKQQEIIDYFVARYGDYVLLKPRTTGTGLPLWLLPPIILLLAAFFAFTFLRKRRDEPDPVATKTLSDEDRERIRRAKQVDNQDENKTDKQVDNGGDDS